VCGTGFGWRLAQWGTRGEERVCVCVAQDCRFAAYGYGCGRLRRRKVVRLKEGISWVEADQGVPVMGKRNVRCQKHSRVKLSSRGTRLHLVSQGSVYYSSKARIKVPYLQSGRSHRARGCGSRPAADKSTSGNPALVSSLVRV
jgi:hypothetical protein